MYYVRKMFQAVSKLCRLSVRKQYPGETWTQLIWTHKKLSTKVKP